jgi:hypothetical protein
LGIFFSVVFPLICCAGIFVLIKKALCDKNGGEQTVVIHQHQPTQGIATVPVGTVPQQPPLQGMMQPTAPPMVYAPSQPPPTQPYTNQQIHIQQKQ